MAEAQPCHVNWIGIRVRRDIKAEWPCLNGEIRLGHKPDAYSDK